MRTLIRIRLVNSTERAEGFASGAFNVTLLEGEKRSWKGNRAKPAAEPTSDQFSQATLSLGQAREVVFSNRDIDMKNESSRILSYGDYFERANGTWVLERIPTYANIWCEFIGNDSQSGYLPMIGVSPTVLTLRETIWEHLYSLFESLALCHHIELRFATITVIDSPQSYASHLNDWMAFFAHLGRIRDMAEKVAFVFRRADYDKRKNNGEIVDEDRTLYLPFDEFYNLRHTVVHYIKTPMAVVDGLLKAPRVGTKPGNWWQKMQWNDLEVEQFVYVADLFSETLMSLEGVAEVFFGKVYGLLREHGCRAVSWNPPSALNETLSPRMQDPPSSSAVAPTNANGAVPPPSGMKGGPWRM